ncbi:MAG: PhnD/SsuA/transferrin family substrate-binding protein [Acidimicrobiales bacterium]
MHIGAIPDQDPEQLLRTYNLLTDYLGPALGVTVEYVPVTDYESAVTGFRTGDLDLVWFGGLTGVQARLEVDGAGDRPARHRRGLHVDLHHARRSRTRADRRRRRPHRAEGAVVRVRVGVVDLRPPHAAVLPRRGGPRHRSATSTARRASPARTTRRSPSSARGATTPVSSTARSGRPRSPTARWIRAG